MCILAYINAKKGTQFVGCKCKYTNLSHTCAQSVNLLYTEIHVAQTSPAKIPLSINSDSSTATAPTK
jgi:hypothetical protein